MAALPAPVSGLGAELARLGCKDPAMAWYQGCWRRLERTSPPRSAEEFPLDAAVTWIGEARGFFAKEQAGTLRRAGDLPGWNKGTGLLGWPTSL